MAKESLDNILYKAVNIAINENKKKLDMISSGYDYKLKQGEDPVLEELLWSVGIKEDHKYYKDYFFFIDEYKRVIENDPKTDYLMDIEIIDEIDRFRIFKNAFYSSITGFWLGNPLMGIAAGILGGAITQYDESRMKGMRLSNIYLDGIIGTGVGILMDIAFFGGLTSIFAAACGGAAVYNTFRKEKRYVENGDVYGMDCLKISVEEMKEHYETIIEEKKDKLMKYTITKITLNEEKALREKNAPEPASGESDPL